MSDPLHPTGRGDPLSADASAERPPESPAPPDPWWHLQSLTPARVGLGRTGASLPTREVLRFSLAHAQARDAVHTPFDPDRLQRHLAELQIPALTVASAASSRAVFLRRPDLGRRLSSEGRDLLQAATAGPVDLALVVADGLSSAAVHAHAASLLKAILPRSRQAGWSLAPIVLASQGRVALGDEIGAILRARAVAVLIGERPGLSAADSLGVYMTYAPRLGCSDAERNCISNVRTGGLSPAEAAFRLHWLLSQAFARNISGVALKDESDGALLGPRAGAIGTHGEASHGRDGR